MRRPPLTVGREGNTGRAGYDVYGREHADYDGENGPGAAYGMRGAVGRETARAMREARSVDSQAMRLAELQARFAELLRTLGERANAEADDEPVADVDRIRACAWPQAGALS